MLSWNDFKGLTRDVVTQYARIYGLEAAKAEVYRLTGHRTLTTMRMVDLAIVQKRMKRAGLHPLCEPQI